MNVEIGPLSRPRVRAASLLLARAFADDGILTHYLARRRGRRIAIPAFFCAVIHERLATTYAATAGPELVGVLSCAGPEEPRAALGRADPRAEPPTPGAGALPALVSAASSRVSQHGTAAPAPATLVPRVRGRRACTARAGNRRRPSPPRSSAGRFTMSSAISRRHSRETQALFRRLGFEIVSKSRPFKDARPLWRMIRIPQRADAHEPLGPAARAP
jgi:hypothetical protein